MGEDMKRLLLLVLVGCNCLLWSYPAHSVSGERGDKNIDALINAKLELPEQAFDNTRLLLDKDEVVKRYWGSNVHQDGLLYLSYIREGTPYLFGGNNWGVGIDCSHFTMRIFQELGVYYDYYQSTILLKSVTRGNGLESVALDKAQFGDLLVYGFHDKQGDWNGHVVILLDSKFKRGRFNGLTVGSHGSLGVKFISYKGFPHYYREKSTKLRNVLRLHDFAQRLESPSW